MPAFSAINLEPEENVDEEVDTTRELHVEDALKLFQAALKLHAQGPRFFDDASDAYDALFESEIFKYPESKTEYERTERQPYGPLAIEPAALTQALEVSGADAEDFGSSLNQALYLSYKNHGQFSLDRIKHKARSAQESKEAVFAESKVLDEARTALDDFNASLDRDPSDAEVWRRTAKLAAFLKSARISRYSLEAAIELDDDPAVVDVEPPSLAEGYAGEQLKRQLQILGDEMALSHPAMKVFREKELPALLKRYLDPLPFLPDPTANLAIPKSEADEVSPGRKDIDVPSYSWTDLGMALVQFLGEHGLSGQAVYLQLPEGPEEEDVQMEIDKQLQEAEAQVTSSDRTEQPRAASGSQGPEVPKDKDAEGEAKEPQSAVSETPAEAGKDQAVALPSRKRSQSTAGITEAANDEQGDTKRSKRTRRRDTAAEEIMDPATLLATQLQPFQAADQTLFLTTKNILENLGVTDRATQDRIAEILDSCASDDRAVKTTNIPMLDMREAIAKFDDGIAKILLDKKEVPQLSLSAFLEHAKSGSQNAPEAPAFDEARGLKLLVKKVNSGWHTIHDVAFEWVQALTRSYTESKWPEQLKIAVVQVISRLDEIVWGRTLHELDQLQSEDGAWSPELSEIHHLVHMIFELHVDVYERITNPNSVVDYTTRVDTKARMGRWFDLASELSRLRPKDADEHLSLRFLWTSVFSNTLVEGVSREHVLACWDSLRAYLAESGALAINLPNNAVIPEISVAAADREISKLTTMDFFLGLFQEEIEDPVALIDTLEPVLNPDSVYVSTGTPAVNGDSELGSASKTQETRTAISECASQELRDLWKFLAGSSTELRLFLWGRLGDAYNSIDYATKHFSCFLRSIEMVVRDFEQETYNTMPDDSRRRLFMTMLQSLDDLLIQALHMALNTNSSFDIIDEDHLRTTASALAKISCILHVAAMFEDEVRIGMTPSPANGSTYTSFLNKLREMQVRTWCLQYTVWKVGIYQNSALFSKPENELAECLAAIHHVLGLRKCCKASNKIFLKMMRVELLKQQNIENWEDYLGQVLYDLHGLKLGVGIWDVQDHGCPTEKLERRQAMALVEKIMTLANRMSMKDLLKSDLKATIEHLQQAIGSTKSTPQMIYNLRNFTECLRKPIHPLRLYQALSGNVALDAVNVNTAESALARDGWFFLLGMIALTKFKAVDLNRRQTPGATDDLRIAVTFLRLQLQFTPDRWDAWFRLAESFDYELDETVLWTSDKMNKDRAELVKFQRNAIHCYTLALSYSNTWEPVSSALVSQEDEDALYDLYHNFGMRLYASSREPFAMEPFQHADQERFFIETMGAGTYKKILHEQMPDYKVWKFAAGLFKRAMVGRPKDWKNPYMFSKCLWKMYQKPVDELDAKDKLNRPTVESLIKALENTIEVVSALPKPRHGQDPILEPHYKILTIIHKLVMRNDLPAQEATEILHRQPYAIAGEVPVITDGDDWESYVIKSLRALRDKDKSNWQHRMIIRHARILFEDDEGGENANAADKADNGGDYMSAKAAFMVLRESMVTKTMVMNVWKCDAERPGRHHVYTEQYIRLLVRLLAVMNDRANLEAVLRRIRKKSIDYYHFTELWQMCVVTYLRLIRSSFKIPYTEEDIFKSLTPEDFDLVGERISEWATTPAAEEHSGLSALKEVVELKKLNANLMKAGPIDDLINDCYCLIYGDVGPPPKLKEKKIDGEGQENGGDPKEVKDGKPSALEPFLSKEPTVLGSLRDNSEQPEKPLSTTGDPDKKPRRVGVRRPDILRKAEQAVLRAAEGPTKPSEARSKSRIGSTSSGKKSTTPGAGGGEDDEASVDEGAANGASNGDEDVEMKDADAGEQDAGGGDGAASDGSSSPNSVHDSADDESDLSDVPPDYEEGISMNLLFPNLRRSVEAGTAASTGAENSPAETSDEGSEADDETEEGADEEEEGADEEEEDASRVEAAAEDAEETEAEEGEEGEGEDEGEGDGEDEEDEEEDEEGGDEAEEVEDEATVEGADETEPEAE